MDGTGIEYRKSLEYVNRAVGIEFLEIKDWNCCGATAGHLISHELGVGLPARNVALSEKQYPNMPIAVPCAACYNHMKCAQQAAAGEEREKLSKLIEMPINGSSEVMSMLDTYSVPETMTAIKAAIKKPLTGLKVACYYGCLLTRPPDVTGLKNCENPQVMDEIVRLTGASTVDWAFKVECCGGSHHIDLPAESKPLLYRIYKNARANGAQALITACPMCMINLDMRQNAINMTYGEDFDLPVYFITELLAVAMGASFGKCGISTHFHPAKKLLKNLLKNKQKEVV
jgi:heterodisulfide reductase subunit B